MGICNSLQKNASQQIGHHTGNSHSKQFMLSKTGKNSAKIDYKGDGYWYNFVNAAEILPNQTAKYSLKIDKTQHKWIMVGFCTNAGLGNTDNYCHPESAYYYCRGGYIWEGGKRTDGFPQSGVGDVIISEVDLAAGLLRWKRNGNIIKECAVPPQMKGKTAYLSIVMFRDGDKVEVLV